tara:strand:+ start:47 stop:550 length:504 start_codon:yes stop_codon:yes gene_type:complete
MGSYAKVINNKVVNVIVADQDFIDNYNDGLGGEWIKTSYNTFGGKHYDPNTGLEDDKPALRYNYAGLDSTYDSVKDAFIPPKPYPSFVLNETTMRYEPPIPYPVGLKGGPRRFVWDEEHYNEYGEWLDMWDTSEALSQHNPDSKYYLEDLPKYEDADYPFNDTEWRW